MKKQDKEKEEFKEQKAIARRERKNKPENTLEGWDRIIRNKDKKEKNEETKISSKNR